MRRMRCWSVSSSMRTTRRLSPPAWRPQTHEPRDAGVRVRSAPEVASTSRPRLKTGVLRGYRPQLNSSASTERGAGCAGVRPCSWQAGASWSRIWSMSWSARGLQGLLRHGSPLAGSVHLGSGAWPPHHPRCCVSWSSTTCHERPSVRIALSIQICTRARRCSPVTPSGSTPG